MKKDPFIYKSIDPEGEETLNVIAEAKQFNKWMYETIKPFCKGNILEIGSGIGNISEHFIHDKAQITLSDIRDSYIVELSDKFPDSSVNGIFNIDLVASDFTDRYKNMIGSFDTVFALNVIEHIEDDLTAIQNCKLLLKPKGHLVILVPAYQQLYNKLDQELFHYRRYTLKNLSVLFTKNHIRIIHKQYFNVAGILGWFVSGKMQKNKTIPRNQMKIYDLLMPVIKIADKLVLNQFGLSAIVIGEKE